jgi:hypothetical protein
MKSGSERVLAHSILAMTVAVLGAFSAPGCGVEAAPATRLDLSDPSSSLFIRGFYGVEGKGWRWTARSFSVALKPPERASPPASARLVMHLYVPGAQFEKLGPLTLYASIDGRSLGLETYTRPGFHDFVREVPAEMLDTNIVPVEFCLDKASPPSPNDGRELGVIVTSVALARP